MWVQKVTYPSSLEPWQWLAQIDDLYFGARHNLFMNEPISQCRRGLQHLSGRGAVLRFLLDSPSWLVDSVADLVVYHATYENGDLHNTRTVLQRTSGEWQERELPQVIINLLNEADSSNEPDMPGYTYARLSELLFDLDKTDLLQDLVNRARKFPDDEYISDLIADWDSGDFGSGKVEWAPGFEPGTVGPFPA